jgi:hypothetical protein
MSPTNNNNYNNNNNNNNIINTNQQHFGDHTILGTLRLWLSVLMMSLSHFCSNTTSISFKTKIFPLKISNNNKNNNNTLGPFYIEYVTVVVACVNDVFSIFLF